MLKTSFDGIGEAFGRKKNVQWNSTMLNKCKAMIKNGGFENGVLSLFSSLQSYIIHIYNLLL